jgi:hypothetical protein
MSGKCAASWSGRTTLAKVKESLEHFSAILDGLLGLPEFFASPSEFSQFLIWLLLDKSF